MKWTEEQLAELTSMCKDEVPNAELAEHFGVPLSEIHAVRSRHNITRDKISGKANNLVKCDCCGSLCSSTTTYIMPDGVEAELCKHCEAVNDFLAAHQAPENEE